METNFSKSSFSEFLLKKTDVTLKFNKNVTLIIALSSSLLIPGLQSTHIFSLSKTSWQQAATLSLMRTFLMLSAILVLVQFNLDSSKIKKNHLKRKLIETMLVIIAKKNHTKKIHIWWAKSNNNNKNTCLNMYC